MAQPFASRYPVYFRGNLDQASKIAVGNETIQWQGKLQNNRMPLSRMRGQLTRFRTVSM